MPVLTCETCAHCVPEEVEVWGNGTLLCASPDSEWCGFLIPDAQACPEHKECPDAD